MSKPTSFDKRRFLRRLVVSVLALALLGLALTASVAQEGASALLPLLNAATSGGAAPTPTPNDEQARLLPPVTPPAPPTSEVIDVDPTQPRQDKVGIIITRAATGATATILMSPAAPEFQQIAAAYSSGEQATLRQLLKPYLQPGDEVVTIAPPYPGGPRPTGTTTAVIQP